MEITEVRIFLKDGGERKLKAYATVTFDNVFVVRNVKVIEGSKGIFVAMPSRKVKRLCPKCEYSNPLRSKYCGQCGGNLEEVYKKFGGVESISREAEHRDIAHPISQEFRDYLQKRILGAYEEERAKVKFTPGQTETGKVI